MVYVGSSWVELDYWTSPFSADYDARIRVLAYSTQDVANNTSNVYFKLQKRITGGEYAENFYSKDFTITGRSAKDTVTHSASQEWVFGRVTHTDWRDIGGNTDDMWWSNVKHNNDGTLTLTANAHGDRVFADTYGGVFDTDIELSFPSIPRASVASGSPNPLTIGSEGATLTVDTHRKSSSFTHYIRVNCGSWRSNTENVGATTTVSVPYSVIGQFDVNSKTKVADILCWTYPSGASDPIGQRNSTVTFQIDTTVDHPNIGTITIQDTNTRTSSVTQDNSIYIANISTLQATIPFTVSGSYTELASATVTCGKKSQTFSLSGTAQTITFEFEGVNASSLSVTVKDKRGTQATSTKSWTLIEYEPVTVFATVARPSPTGSIGTGNITGYAYGGTFGVRTNELTVVVDFKKQDETDPQTYHYAPQESIALEEGYDEYSKSYDFDFSQNTPPYILDYRYQYTVKFTVSDLFSTAEYTTVLTQGLPILSWGDTEVDVWGDLHIHKRDNPHWWQDVLEGFDTIFDRDGMKNLVPLDTSTKTENGITFINYGTYVNVNGTATANAYFNAGATDNSIEPGGTYILSGLHDQYVEGMAVVVREWAQNIEIARAYEDDVMFTPTVSCYPFLVVFSGTVVDNKKWYPMVRDARIKSDKYVSYAPTNHMLNNTLNTAVANINNIISLLTMNNYTAGGTFGEGGSVTKTFQVNGRGLAIFSIWAASGSGQDDTGQIESWIQLLNTSNTAQETLAWDGNRISVASTFQHATNSSSQLYFDGVSSNKRLRFYAHNTKAGTTTWRIKITTMGCTITAL